MSAMPEMIPLSPPNVFLQREPVKNKPDKVTKVELESAEVSRHEVFDYGRSVQIFREILETNRKGKSRCLETEFQNRIIRYMLRKPLSGLDPLLQKISAEAQMQCRRTELKSQFAIEKRKLLSGIEAVIQTLRKIEAKFLADKRAGKIKPGTELFLGTNNILDAEAAIDLAAIVYDESGPSQIQLHQVKGGNVPVTGKEGREIQAKHQEFIDNLASSHYAASYELSQAELSRQEKEMICFFESFGNIESDMEKIAALQTRYESLFLELLTNPPQEISESPLKEYLQNNVAEISLVDFWQLFHQKQTSRFLEVFVENSLADEISAEQKALAQKLREWCLGYLPPAEAWGELYSRHKLDPQFITQNANFVSIIDHSAPNIVKSLKPTAA
ncbi:hypothetical protein GF391_01480 [Candidatus Uhrbacteria bacterium]|nr:hypothetical protein [Candidatus Uhrbacteria bacterium]